MVMQRRGWHFSIKSFTTQYRYPFILSSLGIGEATNKSGERHCYVFAITSEPVIAFRRYASVLSIKMK